MNFYQDYIAVNLRKWLILCDRRTAGHPVGRGWGSYNLVCHACGHAWQGSYRVGTTGKTCPACAYTDPEWEYLGEQGEMCSDGAWLEPVSSPFASIIDEN